MKKPSFQEHNDSLLIGIFAGLISGLFFVAYSELKTQITEFKNLIFILVFLLVFYYILVLFISYGLKLLQYSLSKKKK